MQNVIYVLLRRLRAPLIFLICAYAVAVLGFVLIPGVDDRGRVYHVDFLHAFYIVSYTATTIGFGELPYPFTTAQRLWSIVSLYATVIAWVYSLGSLLAMLRDPMLRARMRESRFRANVRRIADPFYLVCGYGDTGSALVRALTDYGLKAVVLDIDPGRVGAAELGELRRHVPALSADASEPEVLMAAGLRHARLAGVVAVTNDDNANLQIAISAKLLNPNVHVICRAESHDVGANMASFGTDYVINPFDIFAERLALALHAPGMFLVHEWVTTVPLEPLREPLFPPHGRWILCGYGRLGKALHAQLSAEGLALTVVEANPAGTEPPPGSVIGRGTEADTLLQADISNAAGIVAGTDNDANNLSIIMTARELHPKLFLVGRQNRMTNEPIFAAARLDLVMQRASIIAHKIFALIRTPLLAEFLQLTRSMSNAWANELAARLSAVTGELGPHVWAVRLNAQEAPAVWRRLMDGGRVTLGDLLRDPRHPQDTVGCIVLLHKRAGCEPLLPEESVELAAGDELLFCGRFRAADLMDWTLKNENVLREIQSVSAIGGARAAQAG